MVSWEKPGEGFIKVNVDGNARGQPGPSAAGGVLRDTLGNWISGFTFRVGVSDIIVAELWAILDGLQLCWNLGYRKVELETDSMVAFQKLNIRQPNSNSFCHLVFAKKEMMVETGSVQLGTSIEKQTGVLIGW